MKIKIPLRQARRQHEISQEELAKKIGVSRQTIFSIEKGHHLPRIDLALKIANFLNLSLEEIFPQKDSFFKFPEKIIKNNLFLKKPSIDTRLYQTQKEVIIRAEIPGMIEKNLNIDITRQLITIQGEKRKEKEYSAFSQTIGLPNPVKANEAKIKFKNGLLTIKIPKQKI